MYRYAASGQDMGCLSPLYNSGEEEKTKSADDFCFGKTQIGARTLELLPNIVGR